MKKKLVSIGVILIAFGLIPYAVGLFVGFPSSREIGDFDSVRLSRPEFNSSVATELRGADYGILQVIGEGESYDIHNPEPDRVAAWMESIPPGEEATVHYYEEVGENRIVQLQVGGSMIIPYPTIRAHAAEKEWVLRLQAGICFSLAALAIVASFLVKDEPVATSPLGR